MATNIDTPAFERLLKQAFAEVIPPSSEMITIGREIDASVYRGRHWSEIDSMMLDPSVWALTESALIYYLPAYLMAKLRYEWFDVGPLLELLYPVHTPWDGLADWWRDPFIQWDRLMHRLTDEQKHVIRVWLEAIQGMYKKQWLEIGPTPWQDRIELMLRNYWDQF